MQGWIKINIDGASKGDPGQSGYGCVARDHKGNIVASLYGPVGFSTALEAEMVALFMAVRLVTHKGWHNVWFEGDSKLVVNSILARTNSLSWRWRARWRDIIALFSTNNWIITHTYREGNCLADGLANLGVDAAYINYSTLIPVSLHPIFLRDFCLFPSFCPL